MVRSRVCSGGTGVSLLGLALLVHSTSVQAQTIAFELQNYQDSPVTIVNLVPGILRLGSDRRQFVTVKNQSGKGTAALAFQQTLSNGPKTEIIALERVSFVLAPGEKKRLSVSVGDVWNRILAPGTSPEASGKAVLSVVTVEFMDGTLWNAPPPAHDQSNDPK